jgi:hypothetical protein
MSIIEKTFIHLKDDKGWEKIEDITGNWKGVGHYRIRKRARMNDAPELLAKHAENDYPKPNTMRYIDYEFGLVNVIYEPIDGKWEKVEKHMYFEQR